MNHEEYMRIMKDKLKYVIVITPDRQEDDYKLEIEGYDNPPFYNHCKKFFILRIKDARDLDALCEKIKEKLKEINN